MNTSFTPTPFFRGVKKAGAVLFGCLLLTTVSCQKEVDEPAPNSNNPVIGKTSSHDAHLEETALSLAKSLKDASFRKTIKQEALKKFDGDYDILYTKFKNQMVDGYSVRERLAMGKSNIDPRNRANTNLTTSVAAIDAVTDINKLQIAVPVKCGEWNAEEFTPWVAYVPQDFDEGVTKEIKAFDSDGNVHWLDAKIEPNFPVIVVGTSERTDVNGKLRENLQDATNARIPGLGDYMTKINCVNVGAIESWALGAPELEYFVAGSRSGTAVKIVDGSYYTPSSRKAIDGNWVWLDRFIFTWNRPDYDDYIAVKWVEIDDVGPLKALTISWKIFTYDFSKLDRFDDAGTMTVWQGDPTNDVFTYNTGIMAWRMGSR